MTPPRTAIVTGAASGIGAAAAKELAARGYRIACLDRNGPGATMTPMIEHVFGNEAHRKRVETMGVMNRTGEPEEIAHVVEEWGQKNGVRSNFPRKNGVRSNFPRKIGPDPILLTPFFHHVRDRQGVAGRSHAARVALPRRAIRRAGHHRGGALAIDRFSVTISALTPPPVTP